MALNDEKNFEFGVAGKAKPLPFPWHDGNFERMVRTAKKILTNTLQSANINYKELQAISLSSLKLPKTYYYLDNGETCLTPSHLLQWFVEDILMVNN